MTEYDRAVTEDELHAYVDGELPDDRKEAVTAWLATHPDDAGTVAAWTAQAESIRARYGAAAHEAIPERLQLERILAGDVADARPRGRRFIGMAAAAEFGAFVVGGGAGWFAHGATMVK